MPATITTKATYHFPTPSISRSAEIRRVEEFEGLLDGSDAFGVVKRVEVITFEDPRDDYMKFINSYYINNSTIVVEVQWDKRDGIVNMTHDSWSALRTSGFNMATSGFQHILNFLNESQFKEFEQADKAINMLFRFLGEFS